MALDMISSAEIIIVAKAHLRGAWRAAAGRLRDAEKKLDRLRVWAAFRELKPTCIQRAVPSGCIGPPLAYVACTCCTCSNVEALLM